MKSDMTADITNDMTHDEFETLMVKTANFIIKKGTNTSTIEFNIIIKSTKLDSIEYRNLDFYMCHIPHYLFTSLESLNTEKNAYTIFLTFKFVNLNLAPLDSYIGNTPIQVPVQSFRCLDTNSEIHILEVSLENCSNFLLNLTTSQYIKRSVRRTTQILPNDRLKIYLSNCESIYLINIMSTKLYREDKALPLLCASTMFNFLLGQ